MKTLRKEFEVLPDIRRKIGSLIKYDDNSEMYVYAGVLVDEYYLSKVSFINGAWYAYQEQHKKIVAYQKMIEVENCFNKANILSSGVVMHGEYYIDGYTLAAVNGAFHHGENVIHVGKADNPNQTLTINVDENGNIETSNHNGDGK